MATRLTSSRGPVGNDATFQARLVAQGGTGTAVTNEGNAVVQADVNTVSYAVYDLNASTPSTAVTSGSLTVSDVILNTLTDDNIWNALGDLTGRNFIHTVAGSVFSTADHTYRVLYTVVLTVGAGGSTMIFGFDHYAERMVPA